MDIYSGTAWESIVELYESDLAVFENLENHWGRSNKHIIVSRNGA